MTGGASTPIIPEYITVHLGSPDSDAPNVTVPFVDYIANVASSEIYPTWPENAIRANVYAQISFALNRIYTEYYRSRGYDFDITNSIAIDQSFVNGRDLFENVQRIARELFTSYISRQGFVEPLYAQYCDGIEIQCNGLSQWGSVSLAEQGLTVELTVALVTAFDFLIPKLQCHLEGGKRVEALVGDDRLGRYLSGGNYSSFKLFHAFFPPVTVSRISASV